MRTNISRRKSGNGGVRTNQRLRTNQTTDPRLTADLLDEIDTVKAKNQKLQDQNKTLQGKLDEITDVIECDDSDCDDAQHLDTISDIIDGKGKGSDEDEDDDRR